MLWRCSFFFKIFKFFFLALSGVAVSVLVLSTGLGNMKLKKGRSCPGTTAVCLPFLCT